MYLPGRSLAWESASGRLAPAATFSSLMQIGNEKNDFINNEMKIYHEWTLKPTYTYYTLEIWK